MSAGSAGASPAPGRRSAPPSTAASAPSGAAIVHAGVEADTTAIAVPIRSNGDIVGAINVVGPSFRMNKSTQHDIAAAAVADRGGVAIRRADAVTVFPAPDVEVLPASRHTRMRWANGGGWTTEIIAQPSSAHWDWRLSVADVEVAGPFSSFPGIDRSIALLRGSGFALTVGDHDEQVIDVPFRCRSTSPATRRLRAG